MHSFVEMNKRKKILNFCLRFFFVFCNFWNIFFLDFLFRNVFEFFSVGFTFEIWFTFETLIYFSLSYGMICFSFMPIFALEFWFFFLCVSSSEIRFLICFFFFVSQLNSVFHHFDVASFLFHHFFQKQIWKKKQFLLYELTQVKVSYLSWLKINHRQQRRTKAEDEKMRIGKKSSNFDLKREEFHFSGSKSGKKQNNWIFW